MMKPIDPSSNSTPVRIDPMAPYAGGKDPTRSMSPGTIDQGVAGAIRGQRDVNLHGTAPIKRHSAVIDHGSASGGSGGTSSVSQGSGAGLGEA